ncbi:MAG: M3 family oligoendopeptidase [Candidatus Latescibacteria bacterium]|nr:M3 family oligoendopeptidase [Candidatus Latescibacterota bacterium]
MAVASPPRKTKAKTKTDPKKILWDLSALYTSREDPKLERDFKALERGCAAFAKSYRGKVARLAAPSLAKALGELEKIENIAYRLFIYAQLEFSTKSNDPAWGGFMQSVQERYTKAAAQLEFFRVEWVAVGETKARALIKDKKLDRYRHFLEHSRAYKKHTLTEAEEVLATKLGQVGTSAWVRYYGSVLADVQYTFKGKKITESELTAKFRDPDREVRRLASEARAEGLLGAKKPLTFAFNMVLAGSKVGDEVRNYEHWVQRRNLANEIPDAVVDALVTACLDRSDILRRYLKLKKKAMGLKTMMSYDVWAPLPGASQRKQDYGEAMRMVAELFAETRPSFGKIAADMFDQHHVDVPPYQGKRGGAFCMPNMQGLPYVMLNWTGKARDVATLAHEFGHAVHMELSRKHGPMGSVESLVMAEVASVFMETLLYGKLLAKTKNPTQRLHILQEIIEDGFATTFRQMQFNRFESAVHNYRRDHGEMSTEKIAELYRDAEKDYFGNTMKPAPRAENFWMYVSHFVNVPGYVYAYCASYLVVLALYRRYQEEGESFLKGYEAMLAAGGSQAPAELLGALGVDWTDPGFWRGGLDVLDDYVKQFATTARELKLV